MIKDYRRKYGLTQLEFSRCFDPPIPIDTIKKWDSGQSSPSPWVAQLIVDRLQCLDSQGVI